MDWGVVVSRSRRLRVCVGLAAVRAGLRTPLFLLPVLLCSCGLAKIPLQPVLAADVNTIELARLEVNGVLLIRRLNPVFAVMGSSGMVLDAVMVANHAYEYEKVAGPVNKMCIDMFTQTLAQELTDRGYQLGLSQQPYWDYYKKSGKDILARTDAIFRIKLKQMGFWSKGLSSPFVPSLFVQAELIDPVSRSVLYSDRFSMGLDAGTLKIMALGYGKAAVLSGSDSTVAYQNFSDLLKHPEQSRAALLAVVAQAARHIARGFRNVKPVSPSVFNPEPFTSMPNIPLSTTIESGN